MMHRANSNQRSGPTPEQIELTKKNYRLAKELSELRVRNREECKNVTRLTMENMNLASRCREAISHVAMLKKELAHHQKRAQEALKFQREQTQRMASNLSAEVSRLSLSQSGDSESANSSPERNDKSEMERVLASMEPPPPPPPPRKSGSMTPPRPKTVMVEDPPASNENNMKSTIRTVSPRGELETSVTSSDEDETVDESRRNGRSVLDVVESLSDLSSPKKSQASPDSKSELPPRVYSTPNRHRKEDRWTPHIDEAPGGKDADGMSLFPHSASPTVVGLARQRNYNEEFPPDIMPYQSSSHSRVNDTLDSSFSDDEDDEETDGAYYYSASASPPKSSLQKYNGMITMNSIDAFEASFDTTFPSAFANKDSMTPKATRESSPTTEIYNPFAPSPARSTGRQAPSTPPSRSHSSPNPEIVRTANASDGGHPWNDGAEYSTPPKEGRRRPEENSPSRPHKTPSVEARARYEKALQPRNTGGPNTNSSQASVTTTNAVAPPKADAPEQKSGGFSPSNILKRIQQRRRHREEGQEVTEREAKDTPDSAERQFSNQYSPSESLLTQENVAPPEARAGQHASAYGQAAEMQPTRELSSSSRQLSARSSGSGTSSRSATPQPFDESEEKPFDAQEQPEINGRPGGMVARLSALKTRRAVKQPISYAEPALNTKIRQGHSYFPKSNDEVPPPRIVTPEQTMNPV